eukprot:gnl/MRDRNA2_/MRDRNA2_135894_c0_seq1.p1 gnl/MRDRNA2_/MRDRNA2_135894_c0~~gnl/MRDRNA2_/MRDRNA2_135894_c0_seq1.p1  ORF type:complete len:342 (-),score=53.88 gnl/MRDRNA2_/MRDRNA2_135894_c0_seq1:24-1013(-)
MNSNLLIPLIVSVSLVGANVRRSERWTDDQIRRAGWIPRANSSHSHDMLSEPALYPASFTWCNKDGVNYCTISRNQHIPQYCGSCWAHGAISALADRVKIARGAKGIDINPSIQHLLNCGTAGSCNGGDEGAAYQWIMKHGGISTETSQPYLACSSDSKEGFCKYVNTKCSALNTARTCGSFTKEGGPCTGLSHYPNITISEHGSIRGHRAMMKEIYSRGPVACGIASDPLLNYEKGIVTEKNHDVDHTISVVGWGTDAKEGKYWIVRNSWGEFWGEYGYVRVQFGALGLNECSWATVKDYTAPEKDNQFHCHEGGDNCKANEDIVVQI